MHKYNIIIPKLRYAQPLEEELKDFVKACKERSYNITNNWDGHMTVKVLEAAEKSKKANGKEIKL